MNTDKNLQSARRVQATLSQTGISMLNRFNPYIVLWWSAAFPGFGHMLMGQYIRGIALSLSEVIINTLAHVNEAMVLTFCGNFEQAKAVIEPNWTYGYLVFYFYSMWDSYRLALELNKNKQLAAMENARLSPFILGKFCIQYMELRSPVKAALSSFLFPGLGQLYNGRHDIAIYTIIWWWIYVWKSRLGEALIAQMNGHTAASTAMLAPHWLLFMPSVFAGAIYQAYYATGQLNALFRVEQRQFARERYQSADFIQWLAAKGE